MRTKLNGAKGDGWRRFMVVLLVLCVIQFAGMWIYPASTFGLILGQASDKPFGVAFQRVLWALLAYTFLRSVMREGLAPLGIALRAFLPFLLVGLVTAVFGYSPFDSLRMLIMWTIMAGAAAIIGNSLPRELVERVLLWSSLVIMLLCVVYALALPGFGTTPYGSETVWRGFFTNKNQFGWFSSLVLMIAVMLRRPGANRLPTVLALLAVVCLLASGSKGGLAAALAAIAYILLLRWVIPKVTPGFGIAVVLVLMLVGVVFFTLAYLPLLELLGRDATLTGRTSIWRVFFNAMVAHPWLGSGPGSFTVASPLTAVLASRLESFGVIYTPHSSYLGVFGDTGLFGLAIFIGMVIYMSLVEPMYRSSRMYLLSGGLCFLIAVSGIVETHEIYTQGPGWFFLILVRTLAIRERAATVGARRESVTPALAGGGVQHYANPLPIQPSWGK